VDTYQVERETEKLDAVTLSDELPDAGNIHAYLVQRGYHVTGVSVGPRWRERDGQRVVDGYVVTVEADRDPAADLASYVPPPSPVARARVELQEAIAAIVARPPATRTPVERAVLALATLVRG
jgi:hypothetical protein